MTRAADLAKLIAGGGTITVADNSDTLTLESTDADANVGPILNLHRNSASPADNDLVGRIVFKADDDAGNESTFARIEATATDVSNGSEDGRLDFFTAKDDAFNAALSILGNNVGIGTTSPTAELEIFHATDPEIHLNINTHGDAGIIKADADGLHLTGNGSSNTMRFNTNSSERMRLSSSGRLSINATDSTTASQANRVKIDCNNENIFGLGIESVRNSGGGGILITNNETSGSFDHIVFKASDDDTVGSVVATDSSTAYNTSSDYRLKENVSYDFDATTRLKKLKPARFNFKKDKDSTIDGFIAHEVSDVVPNAINGAKDAIGEDKKPIYQNIDHSKLVPLLTKSLQEALARIDTLEAEVAKLKG